MADYYRSLKSENDGPNLPKSDTGYIQGDTALFEQIANPAWLFNRLVIYPRNLLHSGHIPATSPL